MTAAAEIRGIRSYLGTFAPGGFEFLDPAHLGAELVPAAWEQLRAEGEAIVEEHNWPVGQWDRAVDRYLAALRAAAFGPAVAR